MYSLIEKFGLFSCLMAAMSFSTIGCLPEEVPEEEEILGLLEEGQEEANLGGESGALSLAFALVEDEGSDFEVTDFDLWLESLALDAQGADEYQNIDQEEFEEVDCMKEEGERETFEVDVDERHYRDAHLSVVLLSGGSEATLTLEGKLGGLRVRFVINGVLEIDDFIDDVEIPENELLRVDVVLNPGAWFRGVNTDDLEVDENSLALITDTTNVSTFNEVMCALEETTDIVVLDEGRSLDDRPEDGRPPHRPDHEGHNHGDDDGEYEDDGEGEYDDEEGDDATPIVIPGEDLE